MSTTTEKYESKLASKCQGVARCLTFNDDKHQSDAKHTLLEASHMLDGHAIRVHRKRDGLLIINARGKSRYMTLRERLAYWLLQGKSESGAQAAVDAHRRKESKRYSGSIPKWVRHKVEPMKVKP